MSIYWDYYHRGVTYWELMKSFILIKLPSQSFLTSPKERLFHQRLYMAGMEDSYPHWTFFWSLKCCFGDRFSRWWVRYHNSCFVILEEFWISFIPSGICVRTKIFRSSIWVSRITVSRKLCFNTHHIFRYVNFFECHIIGNTATTVLLLNPRKFWVFQIMPTLSSCLMFFCSWSCSILVLENQITTISSL